MFGLNVVLAVIAIAGTIRFVPESADHDSPRLDVGGALLAVIGLVALVYSIIEAPSQAGGRLGRWPGWRSGWSFSPGFVFFERTKRSPCLTRGSSPGADWLREA